MKKILLLFLVTFASQAFADESPLEQRLQRIERTLLELQKQMAEKDKTIVKLQNQLQVRQAEYKQEKKLLEDILDLPQNQTVEKEHVHGPGCYHSPTTTAAKMTAADETTFEVGVVINTAVGTSNQKDSKLSQYQGGGHDPNKRGFNLQEAELSLAGRMQGVGRGQVNAVFLDDDIELEEAYFESETRHGFSIRMGYYLTNFGIVNRQHLHSWDFVDQPLINTRFFGVDGMSDTGLQVNWELPTSWESTVSLGLQNSDGDNMLSFRGEGHSHGEDEEEHHDEHFEETIAGRPIAEESETESLDDLVWSARWSNKLKLSESAYLHAGLSGLYGSNRTGGNTWIYGADFLMTIDDSETGLTKWVWQSEIMQRDFHANAVAIPESEPLAGDDFNLSSAKVKDWGFYTQLLHNFDRNWSTGLRYEYVSGSGNSFEEDEQVKRDDDFDRSDRFRVSPILIYRANEYLKLRLQYNYDDSAAEGKSEAIWLGAEILFGAHPRHCF